MAFRMSFLLIENLIKFSLEIYFQRSSMRANILFVLVTSLTLCAYGEDYTAQEESSEKFYEQKKIFREKVRYFLMK